MMLLTHGRRMRESTIEGRSVKYARTLGCEVYKLRGRADPDRLFIVPGRNLFFFVEFKAPGKKPEPHQIREHKRLRGKGLSVYVIDNFEDFKSALLWEIEI